MRLELEQKQGKNDEEFGGRRCSGGGGRRARSINQRFDTCTDTSKLHPRGGYSL